LEKVQREEHLWPWRKRHGLPEYFPPLPSSPSRTSVNWLMCRAANATARILASGTHLMPNPTSQLDDGTNMSTGVQAAADGDCRAFSANGLVNLIGHTSTHRCHISSISPRPASD